MPKDFIFTIREDSSRAALFEQVFGRRDVFIKSPLASAVTLPGFEDEQLAYFLDMELITQEERSRLIDYIHTTFDIPRQIVASELDERGMPLLATEGIITIKNPHKWFDIDDEDGDWDEPGDDEDGDWDDGGEDELEPWDDGDDAA